jgi:hypothetical protein
VAIQNLEQSSTSDIKSGITKTKNLRKADQRNIMNETNASNFSSDEPNVQNLPTSTPPSTLTSLVKSPSMSLIDDSAQHLHSLMRGLHGNAPPAEVKMFEPERVEAACKCASEIHKLMRLKYDVVKLAKEYP